MNEMTPADWGARYSNRREWYKSLTERLESLVHDLIDEAHIDVVKIEARTKDVSSFVNKIIAPKGARFENPLAEITDLVGVRIITYYLDEVVVIGEIIKREFEVDPAVSVDKASAEPDRFGYRSVHYIVKPSASRRQLPEWRPYADVWTEIQVRTALQHAWSAVNHKLDYKSTTEAPLELRRRLNRLSALFELADEQFSQLRDERARIESDIKDEVREGQLNIPLNEASIGAYIHDSVKGKVIAEQAVRSGADIARMDSRRLARDRADLLSVLLESGITTVAELDRYLTANILSTPIPEGFFGDGRRSLEDALTVLIMTDNRADEETYGRIYMPEGWDDFANGVQAWHEQKAQRR
jgi:putative GTP pyrophosphokinase